MSRLSLDDIDRWDPGAIDQVFGEAMRRATETRRSGAQIGRLTTFADWDGDAADAARDSAHRIVLDLSAHADACEAVAAAAESAVGKVQTVKSRLAQIRSELQFGITIDNTTNAVAPPPDVASRPNARVIQLLVDDLQRMVDQLIDDAELADDDLAAAIRAATGTVSPEQVTDQLDGGPVSVPFPPASGDPTVVNQWWDSMSPQQQATAVDKFGSLLGNVDGIPAAVRSDINIGRLESEIAKQEALAAARKFAPSGLPDAQTALQVQRARGRLEDLRAVQAALSTSPDTGLLLLDLTSNDKRVLAATYVGDVDNAEHVSVTAPGMNSTVRGSIVGMTEEAAALRGQAMDLNGGQEVASIAWIGYETPGLNLDVADDDLATAGALDLNQLYRGLNATTNVGDQHLTALGHSYGSLTTSLALQHGQAGVDDVVLYGSPGGFLDNAAELGVAPGHGYFMVAEDDVVAIEIAALGRFGGQLQDVPGLVPLSTEGAFEVAVDPETGVSRQIWHEGATGHSEYPRFGSNGELRTPGHNMAAVVGGVPAAVIGGPPEPQTIDGPYGPIRNPNYHS
ncbi:MAG: alpha/beta hydrolase [Mycobacterium sp.]